MQKLQALGIFGREVSEIRIRFTCLPRFDMKPVAKSSFILASIRGYLKSKQILDEVRIEKFDSCSKMIQEAKTNKWKGGSHLDFFTIKLCISKV